MGTSSKEVYERLIAKVKLSVKDKERVVYDPNSGIQKTFLDGKLIHVKLFTPNNKRM